MSLKRIQAIIMRHLYLYKGRSLPRYMDIFFWPIMTLLTWGFLSIYLQKSNQGDLNFLSLILGAVIFWEIVHMTQQAISIYFLEEVWERNFLNLFVTPITLGEFFLASVILGFLRIIVICLVMFLVSIAFYHYNFLSIGLVAIPYTANLFLFGTVIALFINAIILRFGTSAQVLGFALIFVIQPISAVFYPVSVLPVWLQHIAYALPVTHVFEAMRATLGGSPFDLHDFFITTGLNILYFVLAWIFFRWMFKSVKKKGLLLKVQN